MKKTRWEEEVEESVSRGGNFNKEKQKARTGGNEKSKMAEN